MTAADLTTIDQVRMLEANAAAAYFGSWRGLPLKWERRWKHPIPDAWLSVQARGSLRNRFPAGNRSATHPMNAMLNYAYGMLQSQVHVAAASAGYDPRQGIMHHDRDDALPFVYDLMEPHRPGVDRTVLRFARENRFSGADFVLRTDGVCRLAPQLAKALCGAVAAVRTADRNFDSEAVGSSQSYTPRRTGRS